MGLADTKRGVKLTLFLNHRCNLGCRYCYNGAPFDRAMDLDTALRAVEFGFERAGTGFLILAFFGGEPLLEMDLIERVVAHAKPIAERRKTRLAFSVSTNATLLDERRVAFLKEHAFQVQVSLDGGRAAQDANRRFLGGESSFEAASAGLRRVLEAGLHPRVVAVMDPANTPFLRESFASLVATGVHLVHFAFNSDGDWKADAKASFEKEIAGLADDWAAALRSGVDVRLDPLEGKVISQLVRGTKAPTRCGFGRCEFAVSPTGAIYPCDRLVKRDDDERIRVGHLDTGLDRAKMRALEAARGDIAPECKVCALRSRCTLSCGCRNYEQTGNVGRISPLLCWYERTVTAEADRVANAMFAERHPAFIRRFYRNAGP